MWGEEYLICDDCGKEGSDVEETLCPYAEDIGGIEVPATLCRDCYHERCMDI